MHFQIFGAEDAPNAAIVTPAALGTGTNAGRLCGKMLSFASAATADVTVCCKYKLIAICTGINCILYLYCINTNLFSSLLWHKQMFSSLAFL